MSVATSTNKVSYTLTTGSQACSVPFYFLENAHIKAIASAETGFPQRDLVLGTDYTLTGATNPGGGTLTTIATVGNGLKAASVVTIKRAVPYTQEIVYTLNDQFPAKTHEKGLDKGVMQAQQLKEQIDRAIRFREDETGDAELPPASERIGKIIGFDETTGESLVMKTPVDGDGLLTTESVGQDAIQRDYRTRAFSSVATMKAFDYSDDFTNVRIELLGYYAAGDGGGGLLYVDKADTTTADNGVTVFVASDGTRLKSIDTSVINLKRAGAKGDGITDDTAKVAAAISYALSSGIRNIFAPAGNYSVSEIAITSGYGLYFYGQSQTETIFTARSGTIHLMKFSGVTHSATFKNFTLNGTNGTGDGLRFDNSGGGFLYNSTFENISANQCAGHGFNFRDAFGLRCIGLSASGNALDQIRAWGDVGMRFENCTFGMVPSTRAGLRILRIATVENCNGAFGACIGAWGKFGADGTDESDNLTLYPSIKMSGCNVEDFESVGLSFLTQPVKCSIKSTTFYGQGNLSNLVAIQLQSMFEGDPLTIENCTLEYKAGSTWKNSIPIHVNGSNVQILASNLNGITQVYNDAFSVVYPIMQSVSSGLDARANYYANAGMVLTGGTEVDYLARYRMGNAVGGGFWNDYMASPAGETIPISGTWRAGDVAWRVGGKNVAGSGGSQYIVIGWVRLTTGSAHVLNTDWAEMRVLTGT